MNINPQMIQQFLQFRQNFTGDAKAQVQRMLNSGQISQAQYDNAVKMAQQLQQMLSSSVRR
jgi:type IV secretory pathway TrbL component